MIERVGKCNFGFWQEETIEETFTFEDGTTEADMQTELWAWAEGLLNAWFEDDEE